MYTVEELFPAEGGNYVGWEWGEDAARAKKIVGAAVTASTEVSGAHARRYLEWACARYLAFGSCAEKTTSALRPVCFSGLRLVK